MSQRTTIAVNELEMLLGHHTAHLEPKEQIEVATRLMRSLIETVEDLALGSEADGGSERG